MAQNAVLGNRMRKVSSTAELAATTAKLLGPNFLWRYILRSTVDERGNFGCFGPFSFGDIKVQILSFVQWQWHWLGAMEILPFLDLNHQWLNGQGSPLA